MTGADGTVLNNIDFTSISSQVMGVFNGQNNFQVLNVIKSSLIESKLLKFIKYN